MAYAKPDFSFDPQKSSNFDPSGKGINSSRFPTDVSDNPYVPTCSEQGNLIKDTYRKQVEEYANLFGQTISYQPVRYNFNTHDFLYGEDPISGYHYSRKMKAIIDFSSYTSFLTKFGIMSDADITIYIAIPEFIRVWGPPSNLFPLMGDIFRIDDEACDRPRGQTPMVFEVTDVEDRINPVDYMGGHYFWKITAKRFDYSYQPNAPIEAGLNSELSDSKPFGRLEGGENPPDISSDGYDVDKFAQAEFNLPEEDQSVYGEYL